MPSKPKLKVVDPDHEPSPVARLTLALVDLRRAIAEQAGVVPEEVSLSLNPKSDGLIASFLVSGHDAALLACTALQAPAASLSIGARINAISTSPVGMRKKITALIDGTDASAVG